MTIELDDYGFMIDAGDFFYLSLSWSVLMTSAIIFIGYKIYQRKKVAK